MQNICLSVNKADHGVDIEVKAFKSLRLQMIQDMINVISCRRTVESVVAECSQYLYMARYLE